MKSRFIPPLLLLPLLVLSRNRCPAAPEQAGPYRDLNTPRDFPQITSGEQWQRRAREIRQQVLVSCGLWPMPDKTPLKAHVFGKILRDGYTIEKVYLETAPGFYLGGNLYRPRGQGSGPFPAVLNPHGHWDEGRFADTKDGSIAARCISQARQGMIAFSYDMVGFNDTHFIDSPTNEPFYQVHHQFATNRVDLLWNINLLGLQTWNSIRALDFLAALPDADIKRLACTGESGGGTQTFLLGAVDDRLAAQVPVVMVSHIMQGGCLCENAPGLRVEYSNMEIAAAAAPRPQLLVSATGDWTKDTMRVEGPSISHIYRLLGAPENFSYEQFNFGHNYNQTSREAVYTWFAKWLLHRPGDVVVKEASYRKEPNADLRVFAGSALPADAMTQEQFIQSLRRRHRAQWEALAPRNKPGLRKYQALMQPAWRHTLQVQWPLSRPGIQVEESKQEGQFLRASLRLMRPGGTVPVSTIYWAPPGILSNAAPKLVVLCDATEHTTPAQNALSQAASAFLARGLAVLEIDQFSSGATPDPFADFFTTYNRTELQQRVRDLLTVCAAAGGVDPRQSLPFHVILAGTGHAGLWALLAAPGADAVVADCAGLDVSDEQALLAPDLFCPGILAMGGFEGAAMLATPHPLLLHDIGENFPTTALRSSYKAVAASRKLKVQPGPMSTDQIAKWVETVN